MIALENGTCICDRCGQRLGAPYPGRSDCDRVAHNCGWQPGPGREPSSVQQPPPGKYRPGDLLKRVIKGITGKDSSAGCGCDDFARTMNAWGWIGCFRNRKKIAHHIAVKASQRGHPIGASKAWSLFIAAVRELRRTRPARQPPAEHAPKSAPPA